MGLPDDVMATTWADGRVGGKHSAVTGVGGDGGLSDSSVWKSEKNEGRSVLYCFCPLQKIRETVEPTTTSGERCYGSWTERRTGCELTAVVR